MKATDKAQEADEAADQSDWHWAEPKTLKVNPTFQSLIPLQSRGELLALEQSIQAEGCRDPLLVWKGHGVVLDGVQRCEAPARGKQKGRRSSGQSDHLKKIAVLLAEKYGVSEKT